MRPSFNLDSASARRTPTSRACLTSGRLQQPYAVAYRGAQPRGPFALCVCFLLSRPLALMPRGCTCLSMAGRFFPRLTRGCASGSLFAGCRVPGSTGASLAFAISLSSATPAAYDGGEILPSPIDRFGSPWRPLEGGALDRPQPPACHDSGSPVPAGAQTCCRCAFVCFPIRSKWVGSSTSRGSVSPCPDLALTSAPGAESRPTSHSYRSSWLPLSIFLLLVAAFSLLSRWRPVRLASLALEKSAPSALSPSICPFRSRRACPGCAQRVLVSSRFSCRAATQVCRQGCATPSPWACM